jgi:polar amino acid transport system substrate-binding protein
MSTSCKQILCSVLTLFFALNTQVQAHAQVNTPVQAKPLRIGAWDLDNKDTLVVSSKAVLTRAYSELNQTSEFVDLPIRRALNMLLNGELDGNLYRLGELGGRYPALFRVETPINIAEIRVYALDPKLPVANWEQLSNLKVGYERGTLIIERRLNQLGRVVEASTHTDLFKLLSRGAVDAILVVEPAQSPLQSIVLQDNIKRLEVILESVPLYHYLSNEHRNLGKKLNTVLQRMQSNGELQKIRMTVLETRRSKD